LIDNATRQVSSCTLDCSGHDAHQSLTQTTGAEHAGLAYFNYVIWLEQKVRLLVLLYSSHIDMDNVLISGAGFLTIDLHISQLRLSFHSTHHRQRTTQHQLFAKVDPAR